MKALREFFEIVDDYAWILFVAFLLLTPLCCGSSGEDGCKFVVRIENDKPTVDAGQGGSP